MKTELIINKKKYKVDLSKPIDISIPLTNKSKSLLAFGAEPMLIDPVVDGKWIGDTKKGGPVNFKKVMFSPHGNGTHTECIGHITKSTHTINALFNKSFSLAELISLTPEKANQDRVITKKIIEKNLSFKTDTVVIRTLPNSPSKRTKNYTNTNPAYLHHTAAQLLNDKNIKHLLVDLPSVDKESDGGAILSHKAYWGYPKNKRKDAFITELVYIPNEVLDGLYLINTQIAPFELDVSPSKPILFEILN